MYSTLFMVPSIIFPIRHFSGVEEEMTSDLVLFLKKKNQKQPLALFMLPFDILVRGALKIEFFKSILG
jgi:hypothetical protein